MLNRKWRGILLILICIAIAASCYVAYQRISVERDNNNVEIAMLWRDFIDSAGKEGLEADEALEEADGSLNAFIFREMTVDDLIVDNIAMSVTGLELRNGIAGGEFTVTSENGETVSSGDLPLNYKYLWILEDKYAEPLLTNMRLKTSADIYGYSISIGGDTYGLIAYDDVASEIPDLGLVFDLDAMSLVSEAGYYVIPRFSAWEDYQKGDMEAVVEPLKGMNIGGIMFNDKSVIKVDDTEDYYSDLQDMAKALEPLDAPVVFIEFYSQKGLSDLINILDANMVRLHTINDEELEKVTVSDSLNRYNLAVNERNVRIIYVKPFPDSDFSTTVEYCQDLTSRLENRGFTLGAAETIEDMPLYNIIITIIAFGIAAGAIFLGERLRIPKIAAILSIIMIVGVTGLTLTSRSILAARSIALVAAIVFPSLAVTSFVAEKRSLGQTLIAFLKMCGITLVGAVFIVGLLSQKSFMTSMAVFSGVKLAMITPLIVLFIYCLFIRERCGLWEKGCRFIKQPVRYGELIILAIMALALLILLLRSGNDGLDATSLELTLRTKLEELLIVRPRTKEFLIGAPCMLLALYYGYKDYLLPLWLLGAIGQVSILNTFCHLHTPLIVSLLRTINGLWLGILIGVLAIIVINWLMKKFKKKMEGNVL